MRAVQPVRVRGAVDQRSPATMVQYASDRPSAVIAMSRKLPEGEGTEKVISCSCSKVQTYLSVFLAAQCLTVATVR